MTRSAALPARSQGKADQLKKDRQNDGFHFTRRLTLLIQPSILKLTENRTSPLCTIILQSVPTGGYLDQMTYVITQPCIGVKDASCVDVCPVDCIHPSSNEPGYEEAQQLFINPDECIDCGACEPACPVTAIYEESAVPEEWKSFIKINADFFKG
jgi:NAD-dependent dihydropyrimidine dehydrogenase PreA subunit